MSISVQNTNTALSNASDKYNATPTRNKKQTSDIFTKNDKLNNADNDDSLEKLRKLSNKTGYHCVGLVTAGATFSFSAGLAIVGKTLKVCPKLTKGLFITSAISLLATGYEAYKINKLKKEMNKIVNS